MGVGGSKESGTDLQTQVFLQPFPAFSLHLHFWKCLLQLFLEIFEGAAMAIV